MAGRGEAPTFIQLLLPTGGVSPFKSLQPCRRGTLPRETQRGTWRLKDPTAPTQSPASHAAPQKNILPLLLLTCILNSPLVPPAVGFQAIFSFRLLTPGILSVGTESSPPGLEETTKGMQFGCPRNARIPCKAWWRSTRPRSARTLPRPPAPCQGVGHFLTLSVAS